MKIEKFPLLVVQNFILSLQKKAICSGRYFFIFIIFAFLGSCSSTPDWIEKLPEAEKGRKYFRGQARVLESEIEAFKVAASEAKQKISEEMDLYIKSLYSKYEEVLQKGSQPEHQKHIRDFMSLESESVLEGAREESRFREKNICYVLFSAPEALFQGDLETYILRKEKLTMRYMEKGDFARASDLLESIFFAREKISGGKIGEEKYLSLLKHFLQCDEKLLRYASAVNRIDRFLHIYPESSEKNFLDKERKRFFFFEQEKKIPLCLKWYEEKNWQKAMEEIESILHEGIPPYLYLKAWNALFECYENLHLYQRGYQYLEKFLSQNPHVDQENYYFQKKKYYLEKYEKIQQTIENQEKLLSQGKKFYDQKNYSGAMNVLEKLLREENLPQGKRREVFKTLLSSYENLGFYEKSFRLAELFLSLFPQAEDRGLWEKEKMRFDSLEREQKKEIEEIRGMIGSEKYKEALPKAEIFLSRKISISRYEECLSLLIQCYRKTHLYKEAIEGITIFLANFPNSSQKEKWEKESSLLQKDLKIFQKQITWDLALDCLQNLFEKHRAKGNFYGSSIHQKYSLGKPLLLEVYSMKKMYWHILWVDEDGIFWLESFSKNGAFGSFQGKIVAELNSASQKGEVRIFILSSPTPLDPSCKKILREKIEKKEGSEQEKLNQFLEYFSSVILEKKLATDVLSVRFE